MPVATLSRPKPIKAEPGWYWVRRIAKFERGTIHQVNWAAPFIPAMFTDKGAFHYLDLCSCEGMRPDEFELGPRIQAPEGMGYDGNGYMRAVYAK